MQQQVRRSAGEPTSGSGLVSNSLRTSNVTVVNGALLETDLPLKGGVTRGKARDMYDFGNELLIVCTDRISAFDVVMREAIYDKGRILTQTSLSWFQYTNTIMPNHLISDNVDTHPALRDLSQSDLDAIRGRSMIVTKAKVIPIECVVRGYLTGSGKKEYDKTQMVTGIKLAKGLVEASKIIVDGATESSPIFTPATKAADGHDLNIDFETMVKHIEAAGLYKYIAAAGFNNAEELAKKLREKSIAIYKAAADYAFNLEHGVIIADTKFEFGITEDGKLILIDEVLTPDSSRFWPKEGYQEGKTQPSFDKQGVRDYLEKTLKWDKNPPAPNLPPNIVQDTHDRYVLAFETITGRSWKETLQRITQKPDEAVIQREVAAETRTILEQRPDLSVHARAPPPVPPR